MKKNTEFLTIYDPFLTLDIKMVTQQYQSPQISVAPLVVIHRITGFHGALSTRSSVSQQ
jgi:fluoride ion exporter CrcB/FEX